MKVGNQENLELRFLALALFSELARLLSSLQEQVFLLILTVHKTISLTFPNFIL